VRREGGKGRRGRAKRGNGWGGEETWRGRREEGRGERGVGGGME